ncbi:FecR family protein [Sphingomonas sp. NFR04]|uniref:FecR family protein n=1 Tax=Sphingomonas sp. NFR04 TaxID=1566283 RepID=UPI0008F43F0F|nr:FecR domain-containing protein [Sphingomonas sp. NFR04]SFJ01044.1 FecR family protein [Sphingomonas sp. NFR04]
MGDEGKAGADLKAQAIDWLVALDCGTADEQAFAAWRDSDPRHASVFAQVAATWRRTADPQLAMLIDPIAPPPPMAAPVAPHRVSRRAVTAGAAALLGVGGAGAFLAWPRRSYAATAVGERRTLRLPDGSLAMLNTDTQLAWRFGRDRQLWVERGEAALLVRAGATPVRLYSDPIEAGLSDGRFNLRLAPEGGQLLVVTGSATAAYRGAPSETIGAGSALTVADGKAQVSRWLPDALAAATAWEQGRIIFDGMRLDRAIAEFNRYLPEKMVLRQADLAGTRLGGAFQIDDPDSFLLALREGFAIDHRRAGDRIELFRRSN